MSEDKAENLNPSLQPWYYGHRARVQKKIEEKGSIALTDEELLEVILMRAIPRRDVKPIVRSLFETFGNLQYIFNAPNSELIKVDGIQEKTATFLAAIREISQRMALNGLDKGTVFSKWDNVLDYANSLYCGETIEKLYILFLDTRLRLIKSQMQQIGSVTHVPIAPRDIVKSALNLNATAVILMHNHPSGEAQPSQDDINTTVQIAKALNLVNVRLVDHLIVGSNRRVCSMYSMGIMDPK